MDIGEISNNISPANLFVAALLIAVSLLPNSGSSQVGFGISTSVEYLENPVRLSDPPDSDILSLLSIDGSLARETQRFVTAINYSASSSNYRNDTLQDREIVEGSGLVIWKITPDSLQWNIRNSRSNELINASDPDIADNRQIINHSSTGPMLTMPLGAANQLNLQLDFSEVNYAETGFLDQARNVASAELFRNVSSTITASLKSSFTETEFDSDFVPAYDFFSFSVVGNYTNSTFGSSIEAGTYQTKRAGAGTTSNPLLKISATYRVNSSSQFSASLFETVEDMLSDLRAAENISEITTPVNSSVDFDPRFGSSNSSGLFVKKTISAAYSYEKESRFNLSLDYTKDERTYESRNQQEIDERMSMNLMLPMTPRLNFSLTARYSELQFSELDSLQERTEIGASIFYRLSDRLSLNFALRNTNQESTSILTTYDGISSSIGVSYRR